MPVSCFCMPLVEFHHNNNIIIANGITEKYGIYFPTDKETVYYAGLDDEDLELVE